MKKEHIMDAMGYIDPALVAAADAPATRQGRKGWVRYGIIAACLCLALVGTAAAAQYFGVQIVPGTGGGGDTEFWIKGGVAYYPAGSLSEEAAALDGPGCAVKALDSWDEVEEFIGVDLMNNPVLDASQARQVGIRWSHGRKSVTGRFLVIGSGDLTQIQTMASYQVGKVGVRVQSYLFTDNVRNAVEKMEEDWDQRIRRYCFKNGTQVEIEHYTAPSGLEAQLMTVGRDGSYPDRCLAVVSLNGVPFILEASVHDFQQVDLAAVREALLQVVDGFVIS